MPEKRAFLRGASTDTYSRLTKATVCGCLEVPDTVLPLRRRYPWLGPQPSPMAHNSRLAPSDQQVGFLLSPKLLSNAYEVTNWVGSWRENSHPTDWSGSPVLSRDDHAQWGRWR